MSLSWAGGSTRRWRRIRAQVLLRDHHECQLRITGTCTKVATCAHHVLGRRITGDDPAWLLAACAPCNLLIGDPSAPTHANTHPEPRRMTQW